MSFRSHIPWIAAAVMLVAGLSSAQAPAPASQPATTQAAMPRAEDPRQLLNSYALAMLLGRDAILHGCYSINTPQEEEMVQGNMAMSRALQRMRQVADSKFGPSGFDSIGFKKLVEDDARKIDMARFEVSPDRQKAIAYPENSSPIVMVLVADNRWRILAGETHKNIPNRLIRLRAQIGAFEELADEIAAGKYALPIEAQIAGFRKVKEARAAAEEKIRAATRPASGPATAPGA